MSAAEESTDNQGENEKKSEEKEVQESDPQGQVASDLPQTAERQSRREFCSNCGNQKGR